MYLIIGYKPSYESYCRGCLMASYGSESTLKRVNTPLEAASFIANNEVYNNGGVDWRWTVVTADMITNEDDSFNCDLECNNIPTEICHLLKDEKSRIEGLKNAKILEEREKNKREEIALQRAKDEAEFERLKTLLQKDYSNVVTYKSTAL